MSLKFFLAAELSVIKSSKEDPFLHLLTLIYQHPDFSTKTK